jgi:hypothetical protein
VAAAQRAIKFHHLTITKRERERLRATLEISAGRESFSLTDVRFVTQSWLDCKLQNSQIEFGKQATGSVEAGRGTPTP